MKYRKKPIEIEAIQLLWSNWNQICDFVSPEAFGGGCYVDESGNVTPDTNARLGLKIKTIEGEMLAVEKDWIIKGIAGEFYPCKPEIFEASYDAVKNESIGLRCPDCGGDRWREQHDGFFCLSCWDTYHRASVYSASYLNGYTRAQKASQIDASRG